MFIKVICENAFCYKRVLLHLMWFYFQIFHTYHVIIVLLHFTTDCVTSGGVQIPVGTGLYLHSNQLRNVGL